jgi:hypothetical protein
MKQILMIPTTMFMSLKISVSRLHLPAIYAGKHHNHHPFSLEFRMEALAEPVANRPKSAKGLQSLIRLKTSVKELLMKGT